MNSIFTDKGRFRITPVKNRQSLMLNKPPKPFSSSIIQEKKPFGKEELIKISSKLELIKSKCMNGSKKMTRSNSKQTIQTP